MDHFKLNMDNRRPRFLSLWQITLPLTGFISILHRISGIVLFLALPYLLYLLQQSLSSETGFLQARANLDSWPVKLCGTILIWLFAHHLFAGVRVLLIDMEWGSDLPTARRTAGIVIVASLLALITGVLI